MALIEKLTAIADAIREKTDTTDTMLLAEMPDNIRSISGAGTYASIIEQATYTLKKHVRDGSSELHYDNTSASYSPFTRSEQFPRGSEVFTVEAAYTYTGNVEASEFGYIFGFGNTYKRQTFSFTPGKIVCYDDDHGIENRKIDHAKHHMCITYDGDKTLKVYIDGEFAEDVTLGGTLNMPMSGRVFSGAWADTRYEQFTGTINYARVYKGIILPPSDIATLASVELSIE